MTRKVFWALVLGGALAIAGCGDSNNPGGDNPLDPGPDNTGGMSGTGGMTGTGGSTGTSSDTCEAICTSECVFQGVDPMVGECLSQCRAGIGQFNNDGCGPQADAFLDCIASVECNPEATQCQSQAIAWGTCLAL